MRKLVLVLASIPTKCLIPITEKPVHANTMSMMMT